MSKLCNKNNKILVIGNANSKWVIKFIKKINSLGYVITLVNDAQYELKEKENYYMFYRKNEIQVITVQETNIYNRCLKCIGILKEDSFDVCHIMFVSPYASVLAAYYRDKTNILVSNFFGTDFYKSSGKMKTEQVKVMELSDTIIAPVDRLEKEIITLYPQFTEKVVSVYFESEVLELLKNETNILTTDRVIFGDIDDDTIVIAAGYKGGEYQQHKMIIDAISNCPIYIQKKVHIIFMMTYGLTKAYKEYIEKLLSNVKFKYSFITEFLSDVDMACLRKRIDIFVNAVCTDAFNAAIQESLYCNTVVICGRWLKYDNLKDNDVFMVEFADVKDLENKIIDTVCNLDIYKENSKKNRNIIKSIDLKRQNIENWTEFYIKRIDNISCSYKWQVYNHIVNNSIEYTNRLRKYNCIMEMWINRGIDETKLNNYFLLRKIKNIVIFGTGSIGKMLYNEICNLDLNITLCDGYVESVEWYCKKILNIQEIKENYYDLIIITPIHMYKEILQDFINVGLRNVVGIDEILLSICGGFNEK